MGIIFHLIFVKLEARLLDPHTVCVAGSVELCFVFNFLTLWISDASIHFDILLFLWKYAKENNILSHLIF